MLQLNESESFQLEPGAKRVPAEEFQAYLDAQEIVKAGKREAERIIAEAQKTAEQLKQEGYEEGLEEGRLEMAEKMVDSIGRTVDYFSALEGKVVDIVMKALKRILGEMDEDQRVVGVVRSALGLARDQAKVTLRVAPTEAEIAQQKLDEITRPYPGIHFLEVAPDTRLGATDCILETELGVVDASLDVQLKAIENSLASSLGATRGESDEQ